MLTKMVVEGSMVEQRGLPLIRSLWRAIACLSLVKMASETFEMMLTVSDDPYVHSSHGAVWTAVRDVWLGVFAIGELCVEVGTCPGNAMFVSDCNVSSVM